MIAVAVRARLGRDRVTTARRMHRQSLAPSSGSPPPAASNSGFRRGRHWQCPGRRQCSRWPGAQAGRPDSWRRPLAGAAATALTRAVTPPGHGPGAPSPSRPAGGLVPHHHHHDGAAPTAHDDKATLGIAGGSSSPDSEPRAPGTHLPGAGLRLGPCQWAERPQVLRGPQARRLTRSPPSRAAWAAQTAVFTLHCDAPGPVPPGPPFMDISES
jgi:hypothetical protein